jgi:hypothetical protein
VILMKKLFIKKIILDFTDQFVGKRRSLQS